MHRIQEENEEGIVLFRRQTKCLYKRELGYRGDKKQSVNEGHHCQNLKKDQF